MRHSRRIPDGLRLAAVCAGLAALIGLAVVEESVSVTTQATSSLPADTVISLHSYNLWLKVFPSNSPAKEERAAAIGNLISTHYDVLAFQEGFDGDLVGNGSCNGHICTEVGRLKRKLFDRGYRWITENVDASNLWSDGGVFIASRWPIELMAQRVFSRCGGSDCYANKGVMYARIRKNGLAIHVFATHLNAAYDSPTQHSNIRAAQLAEIRTFMNDLRIPYGEPIFVMGDMNIHYFGSERANMLSTLGARDPGSPGTARTYDPSLNTWNWLGEMSGPAEWLDYILVVDNGTNLGGNTYSYRMKTKLDTGYPDMFQDLSDHFPVEATFRVGGPNSVRPTPPVYYDSPRKCTAVALSSGQANLSCAGTGPGSGTIRFYRSSEENSSYQLVATAISNGRILRQGAVDNGPLLRCARYRYRACSVLNNRETCDLVNKDNSGYPRDMNTPCGFGAGKETEYPKVNNAGVVQYPFDPAKSCGTNAGGACVRWSTTQMPPRPNMDDSLPFFYDGGLNGRVVSIMSAENPAQIMRHGVWPTGRLGDTQGGYGDSNQVQDNGINQMVYRGQYYNTTALFCLDVPNSNFASGQRVQMFPCKDPTTPGVDLRNQQWILETRGVAPLYIRYRQNAVIRSAGNPNLCLNVAYGTTNGGEYLQLYDCSGRAPTANEIFSIPGQFSFDSDPAHYGRATPDLGLYSFPNTASPSGPSASNMCVGAWDRTGTTAGMYHALLEHWDCSGGTVAPAWFTTKWVIYDWELHTIL